MRLTEFFARHGGREEADFMEEFEGAFLLGRFQGGAPYLLHISKNPEEKTIIGSDEDCDFDLDDPTIDSEHAVVVYHEGFKGWTLEDLKSNFGTHIDGDRVSPDRPVLLVDKAVIKPGGGLSELQFYKAATLYGRMSKAGITRTMRKKAEKEAQKEDEE